MEIFTNYFEVKNINEDQNDQGNHFLLLTDPILSKLERIEIKAEFWYSGHGNNHYKILAQLIRDKEVIFEDRNLFPMARRNFKNKQNCNIEHDQSILHNYQVGDQIFFYYSVSEGNNESQFFIKSFETFLIYKKKALNKVLPQNGLLGDGLENLNFDDNSGQILPLTSLVLLDNLEALEIEIIWNDQGWGNRKGEIHARLLRNQEVINDNISLFGIAEHHQTTVILKIQANESFLKDFQTNDQVEFGYVVGGGGGHSLKIHSFKLQPLYKQMDNTKQDINEEFYIDQEIEQWIQETKQQQVFQQPEIKRDEEIQQQVSINFKRQSSTNYQELMVCKICYCDNISRIFSCGHAVCCERCFNECQLKQCPICRQASGFAKRIYFV